jgi:HEAT repeat protein
VSLAKQAARMDGRLDDARAVAALGEAAGDSDPELRQVAVYALGFFGGESAARLLRDRLNDPDRFVRYNVAVALARRGDEAARATVREMLSTADLQKVLSFPSDVEKQNKIEAIELEAIQALQASVDGGHPDLAASLRGEVDALTRSGLVTVRSHAAALLRAVEGRPGKPTATATGRVGIGHGAQIGNSFMASLEISI